MDGFVAPAKPGFLLAAKGRGDIALAKAVHGHGAGADFAGQLHGMALVGGEHRRGQAVVAVIGQGNRFLHRGEGGNAQDRAKDFFAEQARLAGDPIDDRGFDKNAAAGRPAKTTVQFSAFASSRYDTTFS